MGYTAPVISVVGIQSYLLVYVEVAWTEELGEGRG